MNKYLLITLLLIGCGAESYKFDEDEAFNYLIKQCEFGPRNPGSEGYFKCRDFMINELKSELDNESIDYDSQIKIGGMIEVPASAICADIFASKLDFLSIGTNDLIQYTMAIDRVNDEVNYLYDPLNPAVLRLIRMTINAGHKANIPVSMCGEMAGEKEHTKLLLGLGLREFSIHPATILEVKEIINKTNINAYNRNSWWYWMW